MAAQVNEGDGKSPIAEQISHRGLGRKFGLNVTASSTSPEDRALIDKDPGPRTGERRQGSRGLYATRGIPVAS
jgi:hypothetical protein